MAILLVVLYHSVFRRAEPLPREVSFLSPVFQALHYIGPSGVDLFFVLSGFLIGGLLFREIRKSGRLDVGRFILRRGFKIWPSYYAFLAVIFVWRVFFVPESARHSLRSLVRTGLLPNLLHIQNYKGSLWAPHTWSLAVEEHFYLALPLILILLVWSRKTPLKAIPGVGWISLVLVVACFVFRATAPAHRYDPAYHPLGQTHLRVDGLFLGVFLSYLHNFKPQKLRFAGKYPLALLCLGIALLIPFPDWPIRNRAVATSLDFSLLAIGYACILLAMISARSGEGWIGRFFHSATAKSLAFIGLFSYPIYLWHIDASRLERVLMKQAFFEKLGPAPRFAVETLLNLLAALAVGIVFGLLLEKPLLALRDRLFPARARAIVDQDLAPSDVSADLPEAGYGYGTAVPAVVAPLSAPPVP